MVDRIRVIDEFNVCHRLLIMDEDFELSDHVVKGVEESRKRPAKEFISNEVMRAEFGA